jgi:hypothetical protein
LRARPIAPTLKSMSIRSRLLHALVAGPVAGPTYFVEWDPQIVGHLGDPCPVVGQRLGLGDMTPPPWVPGPRTFHIAQDPTTLIAYGPEARMFRVGEVVGLDPKSFRTLWPQSGYCDGYLVLEELPLATAFGPRGGRVLEVVGQVEVLSAPDVEALAAILPPGPPKAPAAAVMRGSGFDKPAYAAGGRIRAALISLAMRTSEDLYQIHDGCTPEPVISDPRWMLVERWAVEAMRSSLLGEGDGETEWLRAIEKLRERP